jgi:hypothetical protein
METPEPWARKLVVAKTTHASSEWHDVMRRSWGRQWLKVRPRHARTNEEAADMGSADGDATGSQPGSRIRSSFGSRFHPVLRS